MWYWYFCSLSEGSAYSAHCEKADPHKLVPVIHPSQLVHLLPVVMEILDVLRWMSNQIFAF